MIIRRTGTHNADRVDDRGEQNSKRDPMWGMQLSRSKPSDRGMALRSGSSLADELLFETLIHGMRNESK